MRPPDWYPDPHDDTGVTERWWDGDTWGDQVRRRDDKVAASSPPGAGDGLTGSSQRLSTGAIAAMVTGAVVAVLGVTAIVVLGGDDPQPGATTATDPQGENTSAPQDLDTPSEPGATTTPAMAPTPGPTPTSDQGVTAGTSEQTIATSVFSLREGDCFDDPGPGLTETSGVPVVPCSQPHDNEIYRVFNLDSGAFPGSDEVEEAANNGCLAAFASFVGEPYETSELDFFALFPTRESWTELGDRAVLCSVYELDLSKLVGTARNAGR